MTREQLQYKIDAVQWWHTIDLPYKNGILTTPGKVDYRNSDQWNKRFGIPGDLRGKTVLDVGTWDGFFAFKALEMGADHVVAIDPFEGCSGMDQNETGFNVARSVFATTGRNLDGLLFHPFNLDTYHRYLSKSKIDISFYFGVLYHVDDPITQLRRLRNLTKEYSLIETAVSTSRVIRMRHAWEFKPGFSGDPTNKWYASPDALRAALLHVGYSGVEFIHQSKDRSRVTVKAIV